MYVEERMYRLKIGAVAEYCKNYEELGMKVQLKHLPHMVGYYFTEVGGLNMHGPPVGLRQPRPARQVPRRDAGRSRNGRSTSRSRAR